MQARPWLYCYAALVVCEILTENQTL